MKMYIEINRYKVFLIPTNDLNCQAVKQRIPTDDNDQITRPGIQVPIAIQLMKLANKKFGHLNFSSDLLINVIENNVRELLINCGYPPHATISVDSPIVRVAKTNIMPCVLEATVDTR